MHYFASASVMAMAMLPGALSHMIMVSPHPFGSPNNSPLDASGSDFPCKVPQGGSYPAPSGENTWTVGSKQTISFQGTAVHGGGSCQLSLTTDLAPTKDTKWSVIHSIEGGCPSNNSDVIENNHNLVSGLPNTYDFTIPDGIAPGKYTFAWTWFNRVGNREMYMNCAPVDVTGGPQKRAVEARKAEARSILKRANFPDMFKANIGNGCTLDANVDTMFPNPGDSLERDAQPDKLSPAPAGCGSGSGSSPPAVPAPGSGSPSSGATSAATTQPAATNNPPPPPPVATTGATTGAAAEPSTPPNGAPVVGPTSAVVPTPTPSTPAAGQPTVQPTVQPTAVSPPQATNPVAQPSAVPAPSSGSGSGSSSGALTGACETGQWNCYNGGTKFQQCGSGVWSVEMSAAAGSPCKPGTGASVW